MVVELKKNDNYDKYDLITKDMAPFEYVILSKKDFDEPLTGESKFGTWYLYSVTVHEYKTFNPSTGETITETPDATAGYFTKGVLQTDLKDIPQGSKVKVFMVETKNGRKTYQYERLDNVQAPQDTMDDAIKRMKGEGKDKEVIINTIASSYEAAPSVVEARYEVL